MKAKPAPPEWTRVGYLISRARVPRSSSRRLTHTGPDCDSSLVGSVTPSPKFSIYKGLLEVYSRLPALRGTTNRSVIGSGASQKLSVSLWAPGPLNPIPPLGFFAGDVQGATAAFSCWTSSFRNLFGVKVRLAYANAHGALCIRLYPSRNAAWVLKQRDKGASRKAPEKGANQPKDGRLRPNICIAFSHPLFAISQSRPAHYPAISGRFFVRIRGSRHDQCPFQNFGF